MKLGMLPVVFTAIASVLPASIPLPQSSTGTRQTLRAEVNVVSLYFTVRDKRERLVTDLTKDAFRVFEDGKPQEITFFAHHSDVPMNVGVLLDTSTAMARTLGLEADWVHLSLGLEGRADLPAGKSVPEVDGSIRTALIFGTPLWVLGTTVLLFRPQRPGRAAAIPATT